MSTPDRSEAELAFDTSVCVNCADLEPSPLTLHGLPSGLEVRVLRTLDDRTLRSGLVSMPRGWSCDEPVSPDSTVQIFVLSGSVRIGDQELMQHGFCAIPRGGLVPPISCAAAAELVLILDGPVQFRRPDAQAKALSARIIPDAYALPALVPVVEGRELRGFERRVLWLDETTGADTRLLRIPPGFEGKGPGWHPVNEEILCLSGDIAPDDSRPMGPGFYLWNPARSVHGFHEHSRGGCTLLEWHDGPWAYHAYGR